MFGRNLWAPTLPKHKSFARPSGRPAPVATAAVALTCMCATANSKRLKGSRTTPTIREPSASRALALKDYVYHKDRLQTPLIREGRRGSDTWRPASWDEALDLIERRMNQVRENHGAESTLFVQGTGRDVGGWLVFLAYNYGSPNWLQALPGNSCYHPRLLSMQVALGDYVVPDASQFQSKRYDDPDWTLPECYMVWGTEPGGDLQ